MAKQFGTRFWPRMKDGPTGVGTPFSERYFNPIWELIDNRIVELEGVKADWLAAVRQVVDFGLLRINEVLAPAFERVGKIAELGFLIARSTSTVTLVQDQIATFVFTDLNERELFHPSSWVSINKPESDTDYATGRVISYSRQTGILDVEVKEIVGSAGPHSNWEVSTGSGVTKFIANVAASLKSYRDTVVARANQVAADRVVVADDRTAVSTLRGETQAFRNQAFSAAEAAAVSAASIDTVAIEQSIQDARDYVDEVSADIETSVESELSAIRAEVDADLAALPTTFQALSAKNQPGGYAGIGSNGKIATAFVDAEKYNVGDVVYSRAPLKMPAYIRLDPTSNRSRLDFPRLSAIIDKVPLSFNQNNMSGLNFDGGEVGTAMAYGNGVIISVSSWGKIRRSTDNGNTWSIHQITPSNDLQSVATNKQGAWVVGSREGKIYGSLDNGITWTNRGIALDYIKKLECDNLGRFVGLTDYNGGNIIYSTNAGVNWSISSDLGANVYSLAHNGSNLWLVGGGSGRVWRSTDLINWEVNHTAYANIIDCLAHDGGNKWIGFSNTGRTVLSTNNGMTFNDQSYFGFTGKALFKKNGVYFILSASNTLYYSSDFLNASSYAGLPHGFNNAQHGIMLDNDYVLISGNSYITRSTDAATIMQIPNHPNPNGSSIYLSYMYTGEVNA